VSDKDPLQNSSVKQAIDYARQCMENKLIPELTYHNLTHTFDQVMPAAMELADKVGVSSEEKALLAVAVAFHDIGWIVKGQGHELIGAKIARKKLPEFGFSDQQIKSITTMIMATRMPHQPTCLLDEILIDADMAILSRDDFWLCNDLLRAELEVLGEPITDHQWYKNQLAFLEKHRYFTDVDVAPREQVKQKHKRELKQRLVACDPEQGRSKNGKSPSGSLVKSERDG